MLIRIWDWVKNPKHSSAVQAIFTAVIMVTGILYTVFAGLQWSVTNDSLISVQRAFVRSTGITVDSLMYRDQKGERRELHASSHWTNSAPTPAIQVVESFSFDEAMQEPDGDSFLGQKDPRGSIVIGPGGTSDSGAIVKPEGFLSTGQTTDPAKIQTKIFSKRIYGWGWMAYRDVFPGTKVHVTEFCAQLVGIYLDLSPANAGSRYTWNNWLAKLVKEVSR